LAIGYLACREIVDKNAIDPIEGIETLKIPEVFVDYRVDTIRMPLTRLRGLRHNLSSFDIVSSYILHDKNAIDPIEGIETIFFWNDVIAWAEQ